MVAVGDVGSILLAVVGEVGGWSRSQMVDGDELIVWRYEYLVRNVIVCGNMHIPTNSS
jgi:hypothetical protein